METSVSSFEVLSAAKTADPVCVIRLGFPTELDVDVEFINHNSWKVLSNPFLGHIKRHKAHEGESARLSSFSISDDSDAIDWHLFEHKHVLECLVCSTEVQSL